MPAKYTVKVPAPSPGHSTTKVNPNPNPAPLTPNVVVTDPGLQAPTGGSLRQPSGPKGF